jgi:hypothetical protein
VEQRLQAAVPDTEVVLGLVPTEQPDSALGMFDDEVTLHPALRLAEIVEHDD